MRQPTLLNYKEIVAEVAEFERLRDEQEREFKKRIANIVSGEIKTDLKSVHRKLKEYVTVKKYKSGKEEIIVKKQLESNPDIDRTRKGVPTIINARRSAKRSRDLVFDIASENEFTFFVTFTFGIHDRLNDTSVKEQWISWRHSFKRKFPNAYYIAVPEYHQDGGLHIHACFGGITAEELKLVDSGKVYCSWLPKKCCSKEYFAENKKGRALKPADGMTIYNVTAWKAGYSTATVVQNPEAVKAYIAKYISKGSIDTRFINNKRYWVSKNIDRPFIDKNSFDAETQSKEKYIRNMTGFRNRFEKADKGYFIMTNEIKKDDDNFSNEKPKRQQGVLTDDICANVKKRVGDSGECEPTQSMRKTQLLRID